MEDQYEFDIVDELSDIARELESGGAGLARERPGRGPARQQIEKWREEKRLQKLLREVYED